MKFLIKGKERLLEEEARRLSMKCQYNSMMECYKITQENAKFVLEKMCYGEQLCEQTFDRDGRYGRVLKYGIEWGHKHMHRKALFGCYAVQDAEEGWIAMSEKEFFGNYELVEE